MDVGVIPDPHHSRIWLWVRSQRRLILLGVGFLAIHGLALLGNARFPRGPSDCAFALTLCGSILNTTGPALRDLAGR